MKKNRVGAVADQRAAVTQDKPGIGKLGGRPSKLPALDLARVEKLAAAGLTDAQLAAVFDVSEATWNAWKKRNRGFLESLKRGKDHADTMVQESLFRKAVGFSVETEKVFCHEGMIVRAEARVYYPPETAACIFWLKNRKRREWENNPPPLFNDGFDKLDL